LIQNSKNFVEKRLFSQPFFSDIFRQFCQQVFEIGDTKENLVAAAEGENYEWTDIKTKNSYFVCPLF